MKKIVFILSAVYANIFAIDQSALSTYFQKRICSSVNNCDVRIVNCKETKEGSMIGMCTAFIFPKNDHKSAPPTMHQFIVASHKCISSGNFEIYQKTVSERDIIHKACGADSGIIATGNYSFSDLSEWKQANISCDGNMTREEKLFYRENIILDGFVEVQNETDGKE